MNPGPDEIGMYHVLLSEPREKNAGALTESLKSSLAIGDMQGDLRTAQKGPSFKGSGIKQGIVGLRI